MKRLIAFSCLVLAAWPASPAAFAYFTGRMKQIQTPKHEIAWNCQYNHEGKMFWRTYLKNCPPKVEL